LLKSSLFDWKSVRIIFLPCFLTKQYHEATKANIIFVIQILSSHKWYGDFEFEEQSNDLIYLGKFLGFLEYMPEITIA